MASCCQRLEGQLEPVPEDIGRGTKDKERFIPATGLHANVWLSSKYLWNKSNLIYNINNI